MCSDTVSDDYVAEHMSDPDGFVTAVLDKLHSCVPVNEPPFNHNKISSRLCCCSSAGQLTVRCRFEDRQLINRLHIDSFAGKSE